MLSDATFRSLLDRGDVVVRDRDAYRPLTEADRDRRMYIQTGDSHTLLAFTADGSEPKPPPQRVTIDINGTLASTVDEIHEAARPYSEPVRSCCCLYIVVVGALMILGGLIEASPRWTLVLVAVVVSLLIARRVRRGAARFSGE